MSQTETNRLTHGDLVRPMIALAWPMVVIQLLQVAYNVADTAFLGAVSEDAVGALSLAFPLIFFLISVGGGFTAAGAILVAQYTGAKSGGSADEIAGQTLSFVTIIAVGIAIVGFFATEPMLALLPADAETQARIVPLAADYMRIFFLGMPFLFGFFIFVSIMRGYGDTRTPMRIMFVSVLVNVVLDAVLIFGLGPIPRLEIEGAAIATVSSRAIATALGLYILFRTDAGPDIEVAYLVPDVSQIKEIVSLGVPSAIEQSSSSLAFIVLTAMVVTFSPEIVAAYGLGNRLISLVFLPAMGLSQAIDTVVGQNLGADRADRAKRASRLAMGMTALVMAVLTVILYAFPEPIVRVFLSADTPGASTTIGYAVDYMQIAAFMFVFMGTLQIMLGTFRGAGNTKTAMAFSMVTLWVARVPLTYVFVFVLGWAETGIWYAVLLGDIVGFFAALVWYLRGTWATKIIDEGPSTGNDAGGEADRDASADAATDPSVTD
nr:MATE family efflux transporter [Halalkalirubrum salinum]